MARVRLAPPRSLGPVEWLVGAGGVGLLLAAVAGKSPLGAVREAFGGPPAPRLIGKVPVADGGGPPGQFTPPPPTGGSWPILEQHQTVFVRTGGGAEPAPAGADGYSNVRIAPGALAAFRAWEAALGQPIPLTSSWRSYASQEENYRSDPNRFAPPEKSGHPRGRAVDVHTGFYNRSPEMYQRLRRAGEQTGWCFSNPNESWHASIGGCV